MSNEGAGREYRDGNDGFYTDEMRVGRLFKKVTGDDPEPPFHEAGLGRLKVCGQLTTAYATVPTRPDLLILLCERVSIFSCYRSNLRASPCLDGGVRPSFFL